MPYVAGECGAFVNCTCSEFPGQFRLILTMPRARINFLFILFIIVMGSFHAYFVFPIKENTGKFDNIFNGPCTRKGVKVICDIYGPIFTPGPLV